MQKTDLNTEMETARETARESDLSDTAASIARIGREFYQRGWALGTSGNYSVVLNREPLRIAMSASSVDKSAMTADDILTVDGEGRRLGGAGKPSAETLLHLAVIRALGAASVLHTHSVWNTLVSDSYASDNGVAIEGYEMLKGLSGVTTHLHCEWLPIIENSQDASTLATSVSETLERFHASHGFLVLRHGLYTWGRDLSEARRHVEIFEFLLEVIGRRMMIDRRLVGG